MLAFYGYLLNIFGPITPYLKSELRLSYTVSSLHFSAFALGMIGAGIMGHRHHTANRPLGRAVGQRVWHRHRLSPAGSRS